MGGQFPATPPRVAALPGGAIGCPLARGRHQPVVKCLHGRTGAHSPGHPNAGSQLAPSRALEETLACTTPRGKGFGFFGLLWHCLE